MKIGDRAAVKYIAMSFLMTYLFISLSYIFFLPKRNHAVFVNNYALSGAKTGFYNDAGNNPLILFHKTYKSVVENKRGVVSLFAAVLMSSMFVTCLPHLFKNEINHQKFFLFQFKYCRSAYCSLRL